MGIDTVVCVADEFCLDAMGMATDEELREMLRAIRGKRCVRPGLLAEKDEDLPPREADDLPHPLSHEAVAATAAELFAIGGHFEHAVRRFETCVFMRGRDDRELRADVFVAALGQQQGFRVAVGAYRAANAAQRAGRELDERPGVPLVEERFAEPAAALAWASRWVERLRAAGLEPARRFRPDKGAPPTASEAEEEEEDGNFCGDAEDATPVDVRELVPAPAPRAPPAAAGPAPLLRAGHDVLLSCVASLLRPRELARLSATCRTLRDAVRGSARAWEAVHRAQWPCAAPSVAARVREAVSAGGRAPADAWRDECARQSGRDDRADGAWAHLDVCADVVCHHVLRSVRVRRRARHGHVTGWGRGAFDDLWLLDQLAPGRRLGENVHYGAARVVPCDEVERLDRKLAAVTLDVFRKRYDDFGKRPGWAVTTRMQPERWQEDRAYVEHHFLNLRRVVRCAASRGMSLVIHYF